MSMKKTWSIILKVIIAVAGAIAGVVGVQAVSYTHLTLPTIA